MPAVFFCNFFCLLFLLKLDSEVVSRRRSAKKVCKFHRKAPVFESRFNKVTSLDLKLY